MSTALGHAPSRARGAATASYDGALVDQPQRTTDQLIIQSALRADRGGIHMAWWTAGLEPRSLLSLADWLWRFAAQCQ